MESYLHLKAKNSQAHQHTILRATTIDAIAMQGATRSLILLDMPPPLLVVEVVSPNQASRDYRYKRTEYAARGIAEYWIVDAIAQKVTVLEWVEGFYEERVYEGEQAIASPLFPIQLTAAQVLQNC